VAALSCSQGGVSWPQVLVFYDRELRLVQHFNLYSITRGGRESVRSIRIANGVTTVQVQGIGQPGNAACCGTASATVTFAWNAKKKQLDVTGRRIHTEQAAAQAFLAAIRAGNDGEARRYASGSDVENLISLRSRFDNDFRLAKASP
jgi:hypothetical protein